MPDINFDCPLCDQNMEAPMKMVGLKILCPGCRTIIQIPWPAEVEAQRREREKSATVPIDLKELGGLPPDPEKRRIVITRNSGLQG